MRHRHAIWIWALLTLALPATTRADDASRVWLALQGAAAVPFTPFRDVAEVGYGFSASVQRFV